MDKKKLTDLIEKFAPLELAEAWDCSGQIVDVSDEVSKVMLCLTVTDDIVSQARENGCDMIISHHPLFFVPFEYKGINIYCAHTNLDRTQGGTTDKLIEVLGLKDFAVESEDDFVRYVDCSMSVDELKERLRKISANLRYVNNCGIKELKRIAFCAGSGSEFVDCDADAFVTGDIKFHTAVESQKVLFDVGHFESEILVLSVLEDLIKSCVDVVYAKEKSPFLTI